MTWILFYMLCITCIPFLHIDNLIRPNKKIPVFPVTRPTVIFFPEIADSNFFFFFFQKKKDLSTYRPYHFFPCYRKHVYFFFFFPITLWHEVVYCLLIAYTGTMPKCFAIVCRVAESHPTYVTGASFSMHTIAHTYVTRSKIKPALFPFPVRLQNPQKAVIYRLDLVTPVTLRWYHGVSWFTRKLGGL